MRRGHPDGKPPPPTGEGGGGEGGGRSAAPAGAAGAELATLAQAARVIDVLARADAELADAGELTVTGSTGQPRAHPLLAATADQRRVLDGLLRSLSLPMPGEAEGHRRSPSAVAGGPPRGGGAAGPPAARR